MDKLINENFKLKKTIEDTLEYADGVKARETGLFNRISSLEIERENQARYADKLAGEASEMREVLKMYEDLLEKMTEQNSKLK